MSEYNILRICVDIYVYILGIWWRKKKDNAPGYKTIAPKYGAKFSIESYKRDSKGEFAFEIYNTTAWRLITWYLDSSSKMWMLFGQLSVKVSNKEGELAVFIEVPFYQTQYVSGSLPCKFGSELPIGSVLKPIDFMSKLLSCPNSFVDKEFVQQWLEDEDEDGDQ